jgi:predicted nucleic acid-binding protein
MPDKVFVDTNILIYAYSITETDKRNITFTILESYSIVISVQVINEFIWTMNRKFNINYDKLEVLVDRFWKKFKVSLINKFSIEKALKIAQDYKYSYWDSLIIASALENECTILFTEDMQNGQVIEGRLRIKNPYTSTLPRL